MAKQPVVIAVDLGGTNLRWALVDRQGKMMGRWERATASMPDQEALVNVLASEFTAAGLAAENLQAEVKAVGLGAPGRILPEEGIVAFSPNIPFLNNFPLAASLKNNIPWPLVMENDANLFAFGENWLGGGTGYVHMLGITLGTGVGGGLILNSRIWPGTAGTSGEIGHITIEPEGYKCNCGNRGCLETMASASWAVYWVKDRLAQKEPSWLVELWERDPDAIDGEILEVAAKMNDPLALRAFERVGRALGIAIADVVHILGLNRIVIGGRFALAWDLFHLHMKEEMHRRLTLFPPAKVSIMPARLGDDAGLLGAARLAWEAVDRGQKAAGEQ
ncbi:MAG: ROK family protein [Deltaproteobacteria bacterium]|nr:ROK family protein [Deltaproteobacteria bacterium]